MNSYARVFKAFNDAQVEYIVVGGVAMNLLGYPRFTGDIDILLALDPENLRRMARLMEEMGYTQRLPVSVDELGDEKKVLKLIQTKNLVAYTFASDSEPQSSIDVIVGDSLKFREYDRHKMVVTAWDIPVPVVSIDDLIGMKRKTDRKKDADDVQALLDLKGL